MTLTPKSTLLADVQQGRGVQESSSQCDCISLASPGDCGEGS